MALPLSTTNIRLMSGVPFTNDYKHTRWFTSEQQQQSYFNSFPMVRNLNNFKPIKLEDGSIIIRVKGNVENLRIVNYCMFQNANKWMYAFITEVQYENADTTILHMELDSIQTWMFQLNFKPSYVAREHIPLYNDDGTPYVNTIDEGLDYGSDYDTVEVNHYMPNGGYKWLVIVTKSPIEEGVEDNTKLDPSVIGTPQSLCYYTVAYKDDNVTPNAMFNGDLYPMSDPNRIMQELYKNESAVNNVVSFFITESIGIVPQFIRGTQGSPDQLRFNNNGYDVEPVGIGGTGATVIRIKKVEQFTGDSQEIFSDKYSGYRNVRETKLLMHPYTVLIADDFKGNRSIYKTEYINNPAVRIDLKGSLGLSNKVSFGVQHYNTPNGLLNRRYIENETALFNNNPADIPVINDYLTAYLQGNRNSMEHQKATLAVNNVFSQLGAGVAGDQSAMSGNGAGLANAMISSGASSAQTIMGIQGINAKMADINNLPPSIAKMGSNTSYDYGNRYNGLFVMKKQIKEEYIQRLDSFFSMFGCKVNEVKRPNLRTRQNWNYIQLVEPNIQASIATDQLNKVKSVFVNGITLWHTDDVGNYTLSNGVRS